jgi:acylphosphatase
VATVRFLVSGAVQGVGYRYFAYRAARRLGLSGFVRNLADGRVEALARGEAGSISEYERQLRSGPPMATVQEVSRTEISDEVMLSNGFEIG